MKKAAVHLGMLLILTGALAGCSQKSAVNNLSAPGSGPGPGGSAMQEAAVSAAMATAPDLIEDGIAQDGGQMSIDGPSSLGAVSDVAIQPLTFWRRIDDVTRTFEFAFADTDSTGQPTTAHVTIHKKLSGTFNILASTPPAASMEEPTPVDTTLHVVRKPLLDNWVRHLLLKRISRSTAERDGDQVSDDSGDDDGPRWRIAATSGVRVVSHPNTTQIQSIHIQAADKDTTITDPLALVRLRRVLKFASGEDVTLTVTTGHSDDVVVLNYRLLRLRFHNNGDNTYSATFHSAWLAGVHHLGVNALSHGTLFDDTAPYDSDAWILPYVVEPTMLADYRP